jgi:hypothetical protein
LPAFLIGVALCEAQLGANLFGLAKPREKLGLGLLLANAGSGERHGLAFHLLASAVELGPEDREQPLLGIELCRPLRKLRRLGIQLDLLAVEPLGVSANPVLLGRGESEHFLPLADVAG